MTGTPSWSAQSLRAKLGRPHVSQMHVPPAKFAAKAKHTAQAINKYHPEIMSKASQCRRLGVFSDTGLTDLYCRAHNFVDSGLNDCEHRTQPISAVLL